MYDIVVIGGGPAGLTAAIYALRANKKVVVLESKVCGGQIVSSKKVDNYPGMPHVSGAEFSEDLYNQVIDLGAEVKFEKAVDLDTENLIVKTDKSEYHAKAVILALGVTARKLGIENEKELIGKGVSFCATCDGNFFKGKDVCINGGGNVALDDALYLSDICNKVYLVHRRDTFKGDEGTLVKLKKRENVEIIINSNVTKLNGTDRLESIEVTNNEGTKRTLEVSALFEAIGQIPENGNITKSIDTDERGYIISDENCHTNIKNVFVAGDIRTKKLRQLTTATADGSVAATEAIASISK